MSNIYENVLNEFNKRNCKLITTEEQHNEILKNTKKNNYKLNYIASCGHNNNVFYNVFKYRGTGIICPSCKNIQNCEILKDKIKNNEISKINTIEQEYTFIKKIIALLCEDFEIIKAFDGCNIDVIFRPKLFIEDRWVGIQIKTTNVRYLTYSFHINNEYKNCLLLFYCYEDESMWLIPENIIGKQQKISIGYNKSKYNIYKVNKDSIKNKLFELYNSTSKFNFDKLNTPICVYQQREKEFRKYREEKLNFINFYYNDIEGLVYDFKIGNFKIQEKISKFSNNKCCFQLCKNSRNKNGKKQKIQYCIGDNDFYWLNCDNKKYFFVIPEKVLIDKGFIGNYTNGLHVLKVTIKNESLHKSASWLLPYMFDYENINKSKLLSIL